MMMRQKKTCCSKEMKAKHKNNKVTFFEPQEEPYNISFKYLTYFCCSKIRKPKFKSIPTFQYQTTVHTIQVEHMHGKKVVLISLSISSTYIKL